MEDFIILGGGVAGLTAARELRRRGCRVTLIEKGRQVGGLARTFERDGFRFDLGGHRFHSNNPSVVAWLRDLVGDELLTVPRVSHILLNGRFVEYPLALPNALTAFSTLEAAQVAASYFLARFTERGRPDHSFEDWIIKRFGKRMYAYFFQPYTEKVWGRPGREISAEWAAQRIGLPSMGKALKHMLHPAAEPPATAISRFYYPRDGFGTIPEALAREIRTAGGRLCTATLPTCLTPIEDGFEVAAEGADGPVWLQTRHLISTIPLGQLLELLPAASGRSAVADQYHLGYRGLICLFLALKRPQITADSWTYFPDPKFIFGRTHEPKNWSAAMVPSADTTSLCVEIFANPGEPIWNQPDAAIADQVVAQLAQLGWFTPADVLAHWVQRVRHAYPVYDLGYRPRLERVRDFLAQWPRLHLLGRTGSFRYMNSDGVVEDVFRFLHTELPQTAVAVQPIDEREGRWV